MEVHLWRLTRPSSKRTVERSRLRELKQVPHFKHRYARQQVHCQIMPKSVQFLSIRGSPSIQFSLERAAAQRKFARRDVQPDIASPREAVGQNFAHIAQKLILRCLLQERLAILIEDFTKQRVSTG